MTSPLAAALFALARRRRRPPRRCGGEYGAEGDGHHHVRRRGQALARGRDLDIVIPVPGLSTSFPDVRCDAAGLCLMTTAMGFANAATSVSALVLSDAFDLRGTYFLIAGVAGVDPNDGTLGGAYWARYVIDGGLRHEIDPRQIPQGWSSGLLGLGARDPNQKPTWGAGTEVYALNPALAARALALSEHMALADDDTARAYRATYPQPPPAPRRRWRSATPSRSIPTGTAA